MTTPKPCPFCGETNVAVIKGSTYRWVKACCNDCDACSGEVRAEGLLEDNPIAEYARAIVEWNKRSGDEVLTQVDDF